LAKTEKFTGKNVDLERLATRIENYLRGEEFEIAFSKDPKEPESWFFIQARKLSKARTLAGARRSLDIAIRGEPNNFEVTIGTGEWGKNMIMSGLASLLTGPFAPAVYVGMLYRGKDIEKKMWRYITDQVSFLNNSNILITTVTTGEQGVEQQKQSIVSPLTAVGPQQFTDVRDYSCDYIKDYPGWNEEIRDGKMILERQKGEGNDRIIFRPPNSSKEIVILSKTISEAKIISTKRGSSAIKSGQDLMVQITCEDVNNDNGTVKPVFNFGDDVIRGVLAGINELVAEDREGIKKLHQAKIIPDIKYCTNCGYKISKEAKFCSSCGTQQ
jgi:zinc-ribbon domain